MKKGGRLLRILMALGLLSGIAHPVAAADFQTWLGELRRDALAKGISPSTVEKTLSNLQPVPRVIELDRSQPEFTLTFDKYMDLVVPRARIEKARALYGEHKTLLSRIGTLHGVQPRFLVALWGIESDFGRLTGGFDVIPALATLAHGSSRPTFFRGELFNALQIVDQGHIDAANMRGSWAGAMGQVQFMPSSFLRYAVDSDGDGKKDLWQTLPDIFASAANYLARSGWNPNQTWGREVKVPVNIDKALFSLKIHKSLAEWQALGVRRIDGTDLPKPDFKAALVRPKDNSDRTFLVYGNYETILKWNRSHFFALAVGRLADAIGGR